MCWPPVPAHILNQITTDLGIPLDSQNARCALGPIIVAVCYELVLKWLEPETLPDETLEDMEVS